MKYNLSAFVWLATAAASPAFSQPPLANPPVSSYHPLTGSERWNLYWNGTLRSSTLFEASFASAVAGQVTHDPPEWGQGTEGYARRSASEYGFHVIQSSVHQASSAALGYDPRYQACDCKGFWRRSGHAIKWSFLTRNQEGATRIDLPAMAGSYSAGMISMTWYPRRFGVLTDGIRVGNQEMALVVGFNVIREFGHDLKHLFRLRN